MSHKENMFLMNTVCMCACVCVCVSSTAFNEIGGYSNLEKVYSLAIPSKIIPNSTCHLPREDAMHLFRDATTGDLPWPGMTLGLTILATWYWCTDQVHTQTHTHTHTPTHRVQNGQQCGNLHLCCPYKCSACFFLIF